MKKQHLLIFVNLVLIALYLNFIHWRFLRLKNLYFYSGKELDFTIVLTRMNHEWIILTLSLMSLIGISFRKNSKFFFLVSTLYISTQLVIIVLAPSFSWLYFIKLLATVTFIWLLIFQNVYSAYVKRKDLKILYLLLGVLIYSIFLYSRW